MSRGDHFIKLKLASLVSAVAATAAPSAKFSELTWGLFEIKMLKRLCSDETCF